MITRLVFLIFIRTLLAKDPYDYCSICPNDSHTMCLFPEGPGPMCEEYMKVKVTNNLKQYIVDIHNDIRNHVASGQETKGKLGKQPPAANMLQLEWNDELATIAQRWADQCVPINATRQHDSCKKTVAFDQIGQNILTAVTNDTELPELAILILNWYKQVSNVIPSDVDFFSGVKRGQFLIGQYTQLVWAKTQYVGCGIAVYKEVSGKFFNQKLVCNYAPGGNIIGQPIYEKGTPCSNCPRGLSCDGFRKSLCEDSNRQRLSLEKMTILEKMLKKKVSLCTFADFEEDSGLEDCIKLFNDLPKSNISVSKNNSMDIIIYSNISLGEQFKLDENGLLVVSLNEELIVSEYHQDLLLDLTTNADKKFINSENYLQLFKNLKLRKKKFTALENKLYSAYGGVFGKSRTRKRIKRALGKWYNGHCHCNNIYRSAGISVMKRIPYVVLLTIIVLSNMWIK